MSQLSVSKRHLNKVNTSVKPKATHLENFVTTTACPVAGEFFAMRPSAFSHFPTQDCALLFLPPFPPLPFTPTMPVPSYILTLKFLAHGYLISSNDFHHPVFTGVLLLRLLR